MGNGSAATSAAANIVLRPPQWHIFAPSALTFSMDMKTAITSSTALIASFAVGMVNVRDTSDPCLEMAISRRQIQTETLPGAVAPRPQRAAISAPVPIMAPPANLFISRMRRGVLNQLEALPASAA